MLIEAFCLSKESKNIRTLLKINIRAFMWGKKSVKLFFKKNLIYIIFLKSFEQCHHFAKAEEVTFYI